MPNKLSTARITFKLSKDSEVGEDFQDVFISGQLLGKLTWNTGPTAGWYFEDICGVTTFVCPLELESGAVTKYGDPVIIPVKDVKQRALKLLRSDKSPLRPLECADSPSGKHEYSPDEEYAQKHHLENGPICCEHCGKEPS